MHTTRAYANIHIRREAYIQSGTRCTGKSKGTRGRSSQNSVGGQLTASKDWLTRQSAGRKARGQTSRALVLQAVGSTQKWATRVKTSNPAIQHTTPFVTDTVSRVCPHPAQPSAGDPQPARATNHATGPKMCQWQPRLVQLTTPPSWKMCRLVHHCAGPSRPRGSSQGQHPTYVGITTRPQAGTRQPRASPATQRCLHHAARLHLPPSAAVAAYSLCSRGVLQVGELGSRSRGSLNETRTNQLCLASAHARHDSA